MHAPATSIPVREAPALRLDRLAVPGFDVRLLPPTAADEPLLVALHRLAFCGDNGLVEPLPPALAALCDDQLRLQRLGWAAQFPTMLDHVIVMDGEPIGRVAWATLATDLRMIDIVLLEERRGRGVVTAVLAEAKAFAARHGLPVVMHARSHARPRRQFERLGFRTVADDGIHARLEWRADFVR